MLEHGATTVEIKSGYGLDTETESMMLRAIQEAGYESAAHVMATCLAAHAVPEEPRAPTPTSSSASTRSCPKVAEWGARRGGRRLLRARRVRRRAGAALSRGRRASTGSRCACTATSSPRSARSTSRSSSAARSVDHLEATGAEGVAKLAASDVVGVALPTAALTLGRPLPPARALVDAGGLLALATDFNPGSSPCDSLPAVMHLACTQCHLSPAEALSAVTVNAAHVLGIGERAGRLRVGQRADIALLDVPDWRYLAYRLGSEGVKHVIVEGVWALEG